MAYTIEDELSSQSTYSPGLVQNDEELLRIFFHPEHIVNNVVIETAIALEDLQSRGFSVDRRQYARRDITQQTIDRQMARLPEKRQSGVIALFQCVSVRTIQDDEQKRAFIVLDKACAQNIAHASIYSAIPRGRGALRKLRSLLLPLLQKRCNLEDIFP
jgi:hypothetical protein